MTTAPDDLPRVVIVGGGFGGLAAARALRRAEASVFLFDKRNHHLFQPLLYQVATAALSPANIAAPIRKILCRQENANVVLAEVTAVDLETRTITVIDESFCYDYLVLAAGACSNYFGNDAWAVDAPGLKTIDEAIDVRRRFLLAFEQAEIENDEATRRAVLTFAIVGAGPTGVELAGAMAEISRMTLRRDFRHVETASARIVLIDGNDRVLPSFPPELSARARRDLEELGIQLRLSTMVTGVDRHGITVQRDGTTTRIPAHNVIWAAGVRAQPIGATLGVETDATGRPLVGDDLTVPGHPDVFVVGDLAHRVDPKTGAPVPGVAQGAMQMGDFAGRTIAADIAARAAGRTPPSRGVFVYRDKGAMAIIGRKKAVADVGGLRFGGMIAFLLWAFVHVLFLIGFRRKLMAMMEWAWTFVFHGRGARLITGEGAVPKPVRLPPDERLERRPRADPTPVRPE